MAGKSERRESAWEKARELDRVALPLVESLGVEGAYRQAVETLESAEVEELVRGVEI